MTIGIDVVDVARVRPLIERSHFVGRAFSEEERSYCLARRDPAVHFAGTLAAKEAVIKALRLGALGAWTRRIEIRRNGGVPEAIVRAPGRRVVLDVSISHEAGVAVAAAVARSPEGASCTTCGSESSPG